jgi:hypothetical protein
MMPPNKDRPNHGLNAAATSSRGFAACQQGDNPVSLPAGKALCIGRDESTSVPDES